MPYNIPPSNVIGHSVLYELETFLRELLIDELSKSAGPQWHKTQLPNDVLERYRSGRAYEGQHLSIQSISFHPLYYTEFADLRKVIQRSDNWERCFKALFGRRTRDLVSVDLEAIEPVRNKVAHNRIISDHEVRMMEVFKERMVNCVSEDRFAELVARSSSYKPIFHHFGDLGCEVRSVADAISALRIVDTPTVWSSVSSQWWFDSDYVGVSLEPLLLFYKLVETYRLQPRARGTGLVLTKWLEGQNFSAAALSGAALCDELVEKAKRERQS